MTIHLPSALVGAVLVSGLVVSGIASAQDDCPKERSCVSYGSQVIEFDPADGFLQSVIVEERSLTITDFDGTRTEPQVKVATFAEDGDSFSLVREDIEPQAGIFADAQLGDAYTLQKANS